MIHALSGGAPEAALTREARASLQRLDRSHVHEPDGAVAGACGRYDDRVHAVRRGGDVEQQRHLLPGRRLHHSGHADGDHLRQ